MKIEEGEKQMKQYILMAFTLLAMAIFFFSAMIVAITNEQNAVAWISFACMVAGWFYLRRNWYL